MATTALDIFKLAMSLMDELNEVGQAENADTTEYRNRTLHILNILQGELFPFSDVYQAAEKGKRAIPVPIIKFDAPVESLDDYICVSVMPYGLAAHLLMDENPSAAAFFQQRYDELKAFLSRGIAAESEDIIDVYGHGIEYGEFSYW